MKIFHWPVRVYIEDVDCFGMVHHPNYVKFLERARIEWLRQIGFEHDDLLRENILFAVRSIALEYLRPARFNDALTITTRILEAGRVNFLFEQEVRRQTEILATAQVNVVCIDSQLKLCRMPEKILRKAQQSAFFE